jgi:hypothetical protein
MIAYKFLRTGRTGPFSAFAWPEPGAWVRPGDETQACRRGIHACRTQDLPWWLSDELWQIELDGRLEVERHKLVAPAGRLCSRVDAWTAGCAQEFADACAWRGADRAATALDRAGHEWAASQLADCSTLEALRRSSAELADQIAEARVSLTIAGDGAACALSGAIATAAYVAAHAAQRIDGMAGYDAERAWQSAWLVQRLGLRVTDHIPG